MSKNVLTEKSLGGLTVAPVQDRQQYLNILVYGEPGTGKTTLAGSADAVPDLRPVLVVDVEGGTFSLTHSYPEVEVVRVNNFKDLQNVYNELHRGKHEYQTVVLDSLTEIQKFSMYNIMEDLVRVKPDADPDVPGMREWGKNIEQIRRLVRGFRDLPMNTIFTALVKSDKDGKTGIIKNKPYLSGKLADEIAGFLDIVVYAYVKEVGSGDDAKLERALLTAATEQYVAKDRSGRLPVVMVNPDMSALFNSIHSK